MKAIQLNYQIQLAVFFSLILMVFANGAKANTWIQFDQSESPYFKVTGNNPSGFQLISTDAQVNVTGIIAEVTVTQSYVNNSNDLVDATYLFPASSRAAVHHMEIEINGRRIIAQVERKAKAKQQYVEAISQGKTAVLLEQKRPNLFSFSAGNILAGDKVNIKLQYTEYLSGYKGNYEFYFPTIVAPRYGKDEEQITSATQTISDKVSISLKANAGTTIYAPATNWPSNIIDMGDSVEIETQKQVGMDADFKFSYRMSNEDFEASVLTFEENGERYFLSMLHPPKRYSADAVMPQDFIFVMDVSGSMHGRPIELSKTLLNSLLKGLKPEDKFNVVQFAGGSDTLFSKNQHATSSRIEEALDFIEQPNGGGGTEVLPALESAFSLVEDSYQATNVVLITDGLVHVEREVFDMVRQHRDKVNVFTFGTGVYGDNKYLFEGIAHASGTTPFIIMDSNLDEKIDEFVEYLSTPLLTNVQVNFNGLGVADTYPSVPQDIFSQRPLIMVGKYSDNAPPAISFTADSASGSWNIAAKVDSSTPANKALKYLWAREKIRQLDDYQRIRSLDETEEEITLLGLEYNLLTRYTSFIAIDEYVRAQGRDPNDNSAVTITGSRIAGGFTSEDTKIKPLKLAKQSQNRFWNLESQKWVSDCKAAQQNEFELGVESQQWLTISKYLPTDFSKADAVCFGNNQINLVSNSNLKLPLKIWSALIQVLMDIV